ncbi:MAG: DNA ligase D [Gemmatimonadaceae bacterium]|nr:DNA ligase D [Chitinophagaceae bacterium]
MALKEYNKKRSFNATPEPTGGKAGGEKLIFVIQKHDATRLHYDFRLEMKGVLKSWAVPKGPSLNPADKRLAMLVEDHPYDYKDFEGIIPEGNYGAGTVIVWDQGYYGPLETTGDKSKDEKDLLKQFKAGSVKIRMEGSKLKGEFALVKLKGRDENAWLLIKHRDKFAKEMDVTKKDKSVVSGKSLLQMEKSSGSPKAVAKKTATKKTATNSAPAPVKKKSPSQQKNKERKLSATSLAILKLGTKSAMPKIFGPMLATLTDKAVDKEGWLYEVKWDGYRALAFMNKGKSELISRNKKSFNEKFYSIYDALNELSLNAVIDGEVVVLDKAGISDFSKLQGWRSEADGTLVYYVFDLLWYDGIDLRVLPLSDRRTVLKDVLPENGAIRLSDNFESTATGFYAIAEKMGLEGIIAKKADSEYLSDQRSTEWLKIKTQKRQEVVIGGYTNNEGSSKLFSSLLVGVYENRKLQYTGKIGTGFTETMQKEMLKTFKPLVVRKCPFESEPDINKPSRFRPNPPMAKAVWLKPSLVCEVSYRELTEDGVMRHPSFEGMRTDKSADEVVLEKEVSAEKIPSKKKSQGVGKIIVAQKEQDRNTFLNPSEETQVRKVNGHTLKFTNLSKIYWPADKVSKRDMLNYYYQVAEYILPYLKDRPQSLNRFPNGIKGPSFYQKDVTGKVPDWIETYPYHSDADGEDKNFMVCSNEASLLYMASLGCIEMNPWSSRTKKPDNPDWCIIDLDPDKNHFDQVVEAAHVTRRVLEEQNIKSFAKTSGSTGIHIYIPLGAKYDYEVSKEFARMIATRVHEELPSFTSIERLTKNRKGKMYIDFLQNRQRATLAAPYALRPKPGAPVSMPLHWDEVKKGMKITDYNIRNAIGRLREVGDIFKPVLGKGEKISKLVN